MSRAGLLAFVWLLGAVTIQGSSQERQALKEAMVIQEALQRVIHEAEPSIACILVSHSDAYRKLFHDEPPAEQPGKLGGFEPGKLLASSSADGATSDGARKPGDDLQKYDLANPSNVPESYGSGVVIDGKNLLILTNYHVVRDATKIFVRLPGDKGSYADIHAADPCSDLAVLRLLNEHVRPLPEIKIGDGGSARKGQFVVALANPFAAGFRDSPSAFSGIVSNVRQRIQRLNRDEEARSFLPLASRGILLQTDAKLSLGCSGGALLNLHGELIGLTTSIAAIGSSETTGGFALPLDDNVKRVIGRLRQGREVEYGFLGIQLDDKADGEGAVISYIIPGSPANKAGLQPHETILSINGIPVHGREELSTRIALQLAGSEARLEIQGRSRAAIVKLVKHYVPGKMIVTEKSRLVRGLRVDYTSIQHTQSVLRPFAEIQQGVYVREVQPGSAAEAAGLRISDIIAEVDGHEVDTPAEFYEAVDKKPASAPLELTLAVSEGHRVTTRKVTIR